MAHSQQPDGFTRALAKFKNSLDPSLARQFSICTLEDVRALADTIQYEQGPQGILRHLQRLEPFIEAMTQLGTVIEVFTNACDFICFIWVWWRDIRFTPANSKFIRFTDSLITGSHQIPSWSEYLSADDFALTCLY